MGKLLAHPQWIDTGDSKETVGGEPALVTKLEVGDTSTHVTKDGSGNMTFVDAVTGAKTLAQLASGEGGGASTALDNLASVAINTSLISDTDNTDDLGSAAKKWKDGHFAGSLSSGEIKLTPKASSTGAEGTIFYNSSDNGVYVATE